jgi:hypothetical protein
MEGFLDFGILIGWLQPACEATARMMLLEIRGNMGQCKSESQDFK